MLIKFTLIVAWLSLKSTLKENERKNYGVDDHKCIINNTSMVMNNERLSISVSTSKRV